jgi:putative transposase
VARLGRFFIEGQALHVIQRGNNRQPVFFAEDDYVHYRQWLIAAAADNGLLVHAHVFMTNHVHLLVTPESAESLPRTMQSLGRRECETDEALVTRVPTLTPIFSAQDHGSTEGPASKRSARVRPS